MKRAAKRKISKAITGPIEDNEPLLHQVAHGVEPVVPVTVKIRTSLAIVRGRPMYRDEEVTQTVRRQLDARLWDALDADQQEAAMQVYGAWRAVTMGVGVRISDPSRPGGGGGNGAAAAVEHNAGLRATWGRWVVSCHDAGINWRAACEVLCQGKSTREVDALCQRRTGWCAALLPRALDQWCFLRHWKHDGRARPCT